MQKLQAVRSWNLRGSWECFQSARNLHSSAVLQQMRSIAEVQPNRSRRNLPMNPGFVVVPQQSNYIVERFGKFYRLLQPGLQFLIPLVDRIAYTHSLKEEAINIPNQMAITRDNVTISIDGVLYIKVENAFDASYGVEDPHRAMSLLAQTTMRSELGKLTFDKTFEEREALNELIVEKINEAARPWGVRCLRYEIRDIHPPENVRRAMELQAEAERRKRAQILDSEAEMQSDINVAEGQKRSMVLSSEADRQEKINNGQGEANAILARSKAIADGIQVMSLAISGSENGKSAMNIRVLEQYIQAFQEITTKANAVIVPSNGGDVSSLTAQAITVLNKVNKMQHADRKLDDSDIDLSEEKLRDSDLSTRP